MRLERRKFIRLINLCGIVALTGCESIHKQRDYNEQLIAVYFTENKEKLVVIGQHYHYIFVTNDLIINALTKSYHPYLVASFNNFNVNKSNKVSGMVSFLLLEKIPDEYKKEAIADGYKPYPNLAGIAYANIYGEKYKATNESLQMPEIKLNKNYAIKIRELNGTTDNAKESPLKKTAEDVILLGLSPLILTEFISKYLISCAGNKTCQP